jgi:hypothetical protein
MLIGLFYLYIYMHELMEILINDSLWKSWETSKCQQRVGEEGRGWGEWGGVVAWPWDGRVERFSAVQLPKARGFKGILGP